MTDPHALLIKLISQADTLDELTVIEDKFADEIATLNLMQTFELSLQLENRRNVINGVSCRDTAQVSAYPRFHVCQAISGSYLSDAARLSADAASLFSDADTGTGTAPECLAGPPGRRNSEQGVR